MKSLIQVSVFAELEVVVVMEVEEMHFLRMVGDTAVLVVGVAVLTEVAVFVALVAAAVAVAAVFVVTGVAEDAEEQIFALVEVAVALAETTAVAFVVPPVITAAFAVGEVVIADVQMAVATAVQLFVVVAEH